MKQTLLLAFLIFALGLLVRIYQFGAVPISLYWDEVAMLVDAKAVAATGFDMHGKPWYQVMYPSYGDYKLPVYIWMAAISVKLFGVSQSALRFPALIGGLATMSVAAWLARQLFAKALLPDSKPTTDGWANVTALSTLMVVAVSPWAIIFSRSGFEGYLGQLFVGLAVAAQLQSKKNWRWLLMVPLLAVVATYSYFSVRFVWPVVFLATHLLLLMNWKLSVKPQLHQVLLKVVLPLACYAALLLPMLSSPLYRDSNQFRLSTSSIFNAKEYPVLSNSLRELGGNSALDRFLYHRTALLGRELALNLADHLNPNYLFFNGDANLRHGTGRHGLFLWPFLFPFCVGFFFLLKKYPRQGLLLCLWWLVALIPASVPETTPHALRSLNALLPVSIIVGVGVASIWVWSMEKIHSVESVARKLVLIGLLSSIIFSVLQFSLYYFVIYPQKSANDWQAGYFETAMFLAEKAQGVDRVYNEFPDVRFYLWLMAFSDIPAEQFSTWQSKNWMFDPVANVSAQRFDPNHLAANQKVGVFVRSSELETREDEWKNDGVLILAKENPPTDLLYDSFEYIEVTREQQ